MGNKGKIFVYVLLISILLFLSYKIYYYVKAKNEEQKRQQAFQNQIKNITKPTVLNVTRTMNN